MAIHSAKESFSREEVLEILRRNVALYKNEPEFVNYIVDLALYLLDSVAQRGETEDDRPSAGHLPNGSAGGAAGEAMQRDMRELYAQIEVLHRGDPAQASAQAGKPPTRPPAVAPQSPASPSAYKPVFAPPPASASAPPQSAAPPAPPSSHPAGGGAHVSVPWTPIPSPASPPQPDSQMLGDQDEPVSHMPRVQIDKGGRTRVYKVFRAQTTLQEGSHCPVCGTLNPPRTRCCKTCGTVL